MMKLVIAIVQDQDQAALGTAFYEANVRATKLSTTGGFLRAGNTTFLVGIEEERVEEVLDIIKRCSQAREQYVASPADRVHPHRAHWRHGGQAGHPAENPRGRARDAAQRVPLARAEDFLRHDQAHRQERRRHRRERSHRGAAAPLADDPQGEPAQRRPRARHDHGGQPRAARPGHPALALGA